MRPPLTRLRRSPFAPTRLGLVGASLALAAATVQAQLHEHTQGDYTLRSSIGASTAIARSTAREHGIDVAPNHAVLDVVVLQAQGGGTRVTVPAQVQATVRDLLGAPHSVELRPARAGGRISYVGVVDHAPGEVLDVDLQAQPEGSATPLRLQYRERMPAR